RANVMPAATGNRAVSTRLSPAIVSSRFGSATVSGSLPADPANGSPLQGATVLLGLPLLGPSFFLRIRSLRCRRGQGTIQRWEMFLLIAPATSTKFHRNRLPVHRTGSQNSARDHARP